MFVSVRIGTGPEIHIDKVRIEVGTLGEMDSIAFAESQLCLTITQRS
jgi:hypothetical protein